jgi:hypothetical protein
MTKLLNKANVALAVAATLGTLAVCGLALAFPAAVAWWCAPLCGVSTCLAWLMCD